MKISDIIISLFLLASNIGDLPFRVMAIAGIKEDTEVGKFLNFILLIAAIGWFSYKGYQFYRAKQDQRMYEEAMRLLRSKVDFSSLMGMVEKDQIINHEKK